MTPSLRNSVPTRTQVMFLSQLNFVTSVSMEMQVAFVLKRNCVLMIQFLSLQCPLMLHDFTCIAVVSPVKRLVFREEMDKSLGISVYKNKITVNTLFLSDCVECVRSLSEFTVKGS